MTWNAFHNRGEILRTVVDAADERRDGALPMHVTGVLENFKDELDLLSALMLKWHARLSGNIERELMGQPLDLELAVAQAWRRTSDELPGVRAIMDRYVETPSDRAMETALHRANERGWIRLAAAAGVANDESTAAAAAGRRIELAGRSLEALSPAAAPLAAEPALQSASFVDRLRAVLAA